MFHLVRGSVYLLVVLGASFSFLYTSLVTIFTYIVLIFDIYIYIYIWWWCMSSSPMFTYVVSSLSFYACFFMYTIFIFVWHMIPWWVLFKCFKKTGCESLSCCKIFSCKVFQEFVVGINLLVIQQVVMSLVIQNFSHDYLFCCGFVTDFQRGDCWGHILCNWLILWQNALYLYLGRSRMGLVLQETFCSSQVLKPWRLDEETSEEKQFIKAWQISRQK